MRQVFFKGLVITGLVLASGVGGSAQKLLTQLREGVSTRIASQVNPSIALTVPPKVTIFMKEGKLKSGRLMAIDAKEITLFSGKNSMVAVAAINKMVFQGEVKLRSGGTIVIRGDNSQVSPNNNQEIWQEPLKNFRIKDPKTGEAEVILTSVTNSLKLQGIIDFLKNSSYVVEEIQFQPSNKIKITVTPH